MIGIPQFARRFTAVPDVAQLMLVYVSQRLSVIPWSAVWPAPTKTMYPSLFFWKSLPAPHWPATLAGMSPHEVMNLRP